MDNKVRPGQVTKPNGSQETKSMKEILRKIPPLKYEITKSKKEQPMNKSFSSTVGDASIPSISSSDLSLESASNQQLLTKTDDSVKAIYDKNAEVIQTDNRIASSEDNQTASIDVKQTASSDINEATSSKPKRTAGSDMNETTSSEPKQTAGSENKKTAGAEINQSANSETKRTASIETSQTSSSAASETTCTEDQKTQILQSKNKGNDSTPSKETMNVGGSQGNKTSTTVLPNNTKTKCKKGAVELTLMKVITDAKFKTENQEKVTKEKTKWKQVFKNSRLWDAEEKEAHCPIIIKLIGSIPTRSKEFFYVQEFFEDLKQFLKETGNTNIV
ncbi:hypothetical protein Bpfe_011885 [Biomphalaria pfeifferi]|uniref:Uncharacterized protein n=1 Tax=Biomphalaria pfeifferi TaxID=112525 RepID=A0AAD8FBR5_BIOPF|nr:hypothetical protein Bpfe_011885 [Biomphalaria pfeifferi]